MTGFDSKRQASKSLLEQALDALELARDAHCLPGTPTTLVYQAIDAIRAELAQDNPWRDAIDAELICCHIGTVESFPTAKYALNELINWYVKVALDPEVSSAAKALVDRGAAAVSAALRTVVESAAAADEFKDAPGAMDRLAAMARAALKATK